MPDLLVAFGLLAAVLTLSALASGVVERAPLSFPLIFLGIGILLGERGAGVLHIDVHDPTLEAVGTVSLALVLFLDAVKLRFDGGRATWLVPALVLGPGTVLTIALIAGASWWLFGLPPLLAVLLGAILASTDPVVLRDVLRDRRIPRPVRRALSIEAGTNDIVVLPVVLVISAITRHEAGSAGDWLSFLARLFVLSPAVGFLVGGGGSWLMRQVDARLPVRREHQALYGLGLVLAAFAAGQALQGDGFLASFAGGVAVVVLNQELCDCFLEYGEVTAEMAMLLSFVLFGALLATLLGAQLSSGLIRPVPAAAFALFTLGIARPVSLSLVLSRARLSWQARAFLAWFGPRGLNSLLLALLVAIQGVPDAERVLGLAGVVVMASVIVHGVTATPAAAWYGRQAAHETLPEERSSTVADVLGAADPTDDVPRITPLALAERLAGPEPPVVLDVRSRSGYDTSGASIPGSIRILPDEVTGWGNAYLHAPAPDDTGRAAPPDRSEHGTPASAAAGGPGQGSTNGTPPPDLRHRVRSVVTYCT